MNQTSNPADIEQQASATREHLERTPGTREDGTSVKRRLNTASDAISGAAAHATQLVSPEITTLIRLDHTHVLAAFRRYHRRSSAARKRTLVANVCLGLKVHAQLEEEIFYPALFSGDDSTGELDRSLAEHEQMRELMQRLRQMNPEDSGYDETFFELIRTVLHHVADEETSLLPLAEIRLKDQLRQLGWQMTRRRFELLKPHAAEVASTTAQTFPVLTSAVVVGFAAAAWLLFRPRQSAIASDTDGAPH
jgi:hemerythrin superfamily protein